MHVLQPLDVSVYKPLKNHFSNITDFIILAGITQNRNIQINKANFPIVFKEAYEKSMTTSTIKSGFRATGIYPFNPNAILKDCLMPSSESPFDGSANEPLRNCIELTSAKDVDLEIQRPTHERDPSTSQLELQGKSGTSDDAAIIVNEGSPAAQSITSQHPLVTTGLIPPTLADILLTPTVENKKKKNPRVIIKERVLTSVDWRQKIADKEREKKS